MEPTDISDLSDFQEPLQRRQQSRQQRPVSAPQGQVWGKGQLRPLSAPQAEESVSNADLLRVVIHEALEKQLGEISSKLSQEVARLSKGTVALAGNGLQSKRPKASLANPPEKNTIQSMRNRKRPQPLSDEKEPLPFQRRQYQAKTVAGTTVPEREGSFDWSKRPIRTRTFAQLEESESWKCSLTWLGTPKWRPAAKRTISLERTVSPEQPSAKSPPSSPPNHTPEPRKQLGDVDTVRPGAWDMIPGSVDSSDETPPERSVKFDQSLDSTIDSRSSCKERNSLLKPQRSAAGSKLRNSGNSAADPDEMTNSYSINTSMSDSVIELRHLDSDFTPPDELFRRPLASIVTHECFDYFTGLVVFLSTVFIGVKSNYLLHHPNWYVIEFEVIEQTFCLFFVIEISLRVFVFRKLFFTMNGWEWNVLDLILTVYQVLQAVCDAILYAHRSTLSVYEQVHRPTPFAMYFRFLRFLRILRLIRVGRFRRYITEFRVMASSVLHSVRYLLWAIVILFFVIYCFAVHISLTVGRYAVIHPEVLAEGTLLESRWGSLAKSMFSLFQAITGGEDWYVLSSALTEVSKFSAGVFCLYICFTYLYIMNIITGVFVEVAMTEAQEISEVNIVNELRDLFSQNDANNDGQLSRFEFQEHLEKTGMKRTFDALNLDIREAENLFTLLDSDQSGSISYDEFVTGCLRLRGSAKSIDVATLMYECRRMRSLVQASYGLIARMTDAMDIEYSNNFNNNVTHSSCMLSPLRQPDFSTEASPITPVLT